jgi:hypothetical protein
MPTYDVADLPQEAGLDGEFLSYITLDGSNEKDVLLILRRLASLVQPLMRRRG